MDPIIIKYPSKFALFKRKRKERSNELSLIQKCEGCGCKLHITSLQQITCHTKLKTTLTITSEYEPLKEVDIDGEQE